MASTRKRRSSTKKSNSCSPTAKTIEQKEVLRYIAQNDITFVTGPAGTGKTMLATLWGLDAFQKNKYKKLIFTRPAVEAYGEKLGYLPGDVEDKIGPYMLPIFNFLSNVLAADYIHKLMKEKIIQTIPLAYQRGLTFEDSFVLADEFQNTKVEQMRLFLTRLGPNSKVVVTGDLEQSDISGDNGLSDAVRRFQGVEGIGVVKMTEASIIRHPLIGKIEQKYKEQ